MGMAVRRMKSPGPIADAFVRDPAFIVGIIGPVGSGKTMAALQKGLRLAARQLGTVRPDGVIVRKARIGVIRESYPSLQSTTLKSWFRIVPEEEGTFSWKAPYTHKFTKILKREGNRKDGRVLEILECEFEFRAIGDLSVEEACRGWEVNAVIIDEADLQPPSLVPFLTGRVGRFSDLDPSLVVDPQIILSLNMPDIDNHIYHLLMDESSDVLGLTDEEAEILRSTLGDRKLIEKFVQPGGREPDAENLHNLPGGRGYYVLQVAANRNTPGYVDRMVDNKPVPIQHGQPVNAGFIYTTHVRPVEWDPRRKLIVGVDQGLFAAAVCLQRNWDGAIRTLAECVNTTRDDKGKVQLMKVGPTAFGKKLKRMLTETFPGIADDMIRVVADPAAFAAKDRQDNEHDWLLAFQKALGLKVHKAKSNSAGLRNQAIWDAHGQIGGYAVDPGCRHLIKGHSGGYRYAKAEMSTGEIRSSPEIADTIYTHVCDAEQYAALEGEHVISDLRGRDRKARTVTVKSDFNEHEGVG
ncbi:hypothetical protein [uncultured Sphingomonas sp.]|uniref:hypothetical protein n=1 Tax=uncultured Sphingomonas sp. TaxID=158754 RepID=UPI0025DE7E06|nr:hypothetical protein [uncultured Sphingomonas sp.]